MAHTPGPWSEPAEYGGGGLEITGNGRSICIIPPKRVLDGARVVETTFRDLAIEDARLIAAAPDLLVALTKLLPILEAVRYTAGLSGNQIERMKAARAAIARATGTNQTAES